MTTNVQSNNDTARLIAAKVLNEWELGQNGSCGEKHFADRILDNYLNQTTQKQRATDLTFGTIRNCTAIDMVLTNIAETPPKRISNSLINIVRIGIYELIYCPMTPTYSIINEAAQSAKSFAGQKQVGFVNAVLRNIASKIVNRQVSLADANLRKTLPLDFETGCEFAKLFLPDSKSACDDYLSAVFSLPKWLVSGWIEQFGSERTRQVCFASNRRPGIYIRPNILKTATYELIELFNQAKIDCEITPDEMMIRLSAQKDIAKLPGYDKGLFTVQDLTAAKPLQNIALGPNSLMLDFCAAPGTKTAQLAEITKDNSKIIATDIDNSRLDMINQNLNRLGFKSVEVIAYEKLNSRLEQIGQLDFILLDVPCSNTGVLAKRPEVRHRLKPKSVEKLSQTQSEILNTAAKLIKSAGIICYTTCSIQKQENQQLVASFLSRNSRFTLESESLTLPSYGNFDHDGGYYAIIRNS